VRWSVFAAVTRNRLLEKPIRDDERAKSRDVVIVGGGPVGMFLAAELRLADVEVLVVERLPEDALRSKYDTAALTPQDIRGLTARTVQTLDLRGLARKVEAIAPEAHLRLNAMAGALKRASEGRKRSDYETVLDEIGRVKSIK
jgi:2-polyprenyl-6-methoxyphenol hydroxylase-like FAD-dependent oxidoreductase